METVLVWVLVFYFDTRGGPTVIDNIASAQQCEWMKQEVSRQWPGNNRSAGRCYQIRKVKT